MDEGLAVGDRGEHAELRGAGPRPGGETDGARTDVLAAIAHVFPRVAPGDNGDGAPLGRFRVLLPHHRVGARGEWRAGEDTGRLPRPEGPRRETARGHRFD